MIFRIFFFCLLTITLGVGCGPSESVHFGPGETPLPRTEQEKAQIKTEDEKIDAAENANTPKPPVGKRR